MKELLFVFLVFSLFVSGFVLQTEIGAYDNTGWNFTGAELAKVFFNYSGAFLIICGVVLLLKRGRDKT